MAFLFPLLLRSEVAQRLYWFLRVDLEEALGESSVGGCLEMFCFYPIWSCWERKGAGI